MTSLLDKLFNKELFLKKNDKFDLCTLQNIYSLSLEKAQKEIAQFKKDGLPECFYIICSKCKKRSASGTIEQYEKLKNNEFECASCGCKEVLTDTHPGIYTFLFNEKAQKLNHDQYDTLNEKIEKSFHL